MLCDHESEVGESSGEAMRACKLSPALIQVVLLLFCYFVCPWPLCFFVHVRAILRGLVAAEILDASHFNIFAA